MAQTLITGSGSYIPENVITKEYFRGTTFFDEDGKVLEKDFEEIVSKFEEITEIRERRYAGEEVRNSDMGLFAATQALDASGIDPETLDYILYATNFGEIDEKGRASFMPTMAARLKNKLGIRNRKCITYDMIFGCPGWLEACILGHQLLQAGQAKKILVVGSDKLSRVTDPYDRNKMIFSDGAGAVVLESKEGQGSGILANNTFCDNAEEMNYLETSSSLNPEISQEGPYIRMRGRKIYEYALTHVAQSIKETLDGAGFTIRDVNKILIHQANAKMDHAIISRLYKLYGIRQVDPNIAPMTIQQLGNSSVATIPTLYDLINRRKMLNHSFSSGDLIVMASVGAGMNINCLLYRIP